MRRLGTVLILLLAGCGDDPAGSWAGVPTPTPDPAPVEFLELGATASSDDLAGVGFRFTALPDDAVLTGPHYAFALNSVAVTGELDETQLRAVNLHHTVAVPPLRAAAGHEFLVVYLTDTDAGSGTTLGGDRASVVVAGRARPLSEIPHADMVIVVSLPTGGDAVLTVTDAGETNSINLRTGEPVTDTNRAADALEGGSVDLEEGVQIEGVTPAERYDGLQVRVTLDPSAHDDEQGWAETGRMWLAVDFSLSMASLVNDQAALRLDLAESLAIQGSDGTTLPIPTETLEASAPVPGIAVIEWSDVFDVPDTLRSFEVSYATHGTFTDESGSPLTYTRYQVTSHGTAELTER
jgi:hypothetical protein